MISATLPSFWDKYRNLDLKMKYQARKAYRIWIEDPFHPSLVSNALIKRRISGQSDSPSVIELWGFWTGTLLRGSGWEITANMKSFSGEEKQ
jgi:hypothetical protein